MAAHRQRPASASGHSGQTHAGSVPLLSAAAAAATGTGAAHTAAAAAAAPSGQLSSPHMPAGPSSVSPSVPAAAAPQSPSNQHLGSRPPQRLHITPAYLADYDGGAEAEPTEDESPAKTRRLRR